METENVISKTSVKITLKTSCIHIYQKYFYLRHIWIKKLFCLLLLFILWVDNPQGVGSKFHTFFKEEHSSSPEISFNNMAILLSPHLQSELPRKELWEMDAAKYSAMTSKKYLLWLYILYINDSPGCNAPAYSLILF